MYIAAGTYRNRVGEEARLEFATLDEAMGKLRDWIEADEIDDDPDAPMFSHYTILVNPPAGDQPASAPLFTGMRLAGN